MQICAVAPSNWEAKNEILLLSEVRGKNPTTSTYPDFSANVLLSQQMN